MADLITVARARLNPDLAGQTTERLNVLISVSSIMINRLYTIAESVPEDVQQACVLLSLYLTKDFDASSDRLGDWGRTSSSSSGSAPKISPIITRLLYPYKTPGLAPVNHAVDLTPDVLQTYRVSSNVSSDDDSAVWP